MIMLETAAAGLTGSALHRFLSAAWRRFPAGALPAGVATGLDGVGVDGEPVDGGVPRTASRPHSSRA
jgi:hypothetical protein